MHGLYTASAVRVGAGAPWDWMWVWMRVPRAYSLPFHGSRPVVPCLATLIAQSSKFTRKTREGKKLVIGLLVEQMKNNVNLTKL